MYSAMNSAKPRLTGEILYYRFADPPGFPNSTALVMIASVSNVGTTPSVVDHWTCNLVVQTAGGPVPLHGEARAVPDNITLGRGRNQPMVFTRDDALYVKGMKTPIAPGAKIVGVLLYHFPRLSRELVISPNNSIVVRFKDVFGDDHKLNVKNFSPVPQYSDEPYEWIDVPGLERPTNISPPSSPKR